MEPILVTDPLAQSADIVAGNLDTLATLFPEAFTEGKIDFDVFRQLLGGAVDEREEKYGLTWHGKRASRQLALTPSTGTLRPAPEDSVDWDTTQNLMIEGDNLEVLKLLQKSYAGQVKLIYIDPPYNTGKDFVYPDDFRDAIHNYQSLTGQVESDGRKLTSNQESNGRFHTDWLNMIYPRLILARQILHPEGLIFVSIDDAEMDAMRMVMRSIFGEENEIATLVWDKNRKNDAKYFSVGHEYMVVFSKDKSRLVEIGLILREPKPGIDEARKLYDHLVNQHSGDLDLVAKSWRDHFRALPSSDPRKPLGRFSKVGQKGPYRDDGDISWPGGGGPTYVVNHPATGKPTKVPAGGWVYPTYERFIEEVERGRVVFGPDETTMPRQIRHLFESEGQVMTSVNFSYAQTATLDLIDLMGARVFDNPKHWPDILRLLRYVTQTSDTVLDFFAGSGTTGHAVIANNINEDRERRFILVQIPLPLDIEKKEQKTAAEYCVKLGRPLNIAELTKERLRRAGAKVRADHPMFAGDTGFRVFKLDSSNIRAWEPDRDDLAGTLLANVDHLKDGRTDLDVLYELLLKLGLDLCVPIETRTIAGTTVYSVGMGTLFVALPETLTQADAEPLALGIAAWRDALAPAGDTTAVFRDSAFVDDVAKTNLAQILIQHGVKTVRSL